MTLPYPQISVPTVGAQLSLNRASEKRFDAEWLEACLTSASSRFLLLADLSPAVVSTPDRSQTALRWFAAGDLAGLDLRGGNALLLGTDAAGTAHFAISLTQGHGAEAAALIAAHAPFVDVRSLALQDVMPPEELGIAAQARALAAWHGVNRCCGRCGGATVVKNAGWRRQCHACGLNVFPRTDPVVIMMVTDGERCLLGSERRFPDKFYSVLAGYIEPGDDIEHAVRREVAEEAGVRVGRVAYVASQPWPFPHTLMIGCWAEALSCELTVDPHELLDARWVDREEARAMLEARHTDGLYVPHRLSMAHTLIRAFVDRSYVAPWEKD